MHRFAEGDPPSPAPLMPMTISDNDFSTMARSFMAHAF
jgi:hypothetical protein